MQTLLVIFGLPGAGKTYVGKVLEKYFGFYYYDGDTDLDDEMKQAIQTKSHFTDSMRENFFHRLQKSISTLQKQHTKIAVSQTFIKEQYRKEFLQRFPHARFILVQTEEALREKRLAQRKELPLDADYARFMVKHFEVPQIPHNEIENNTEGEENLKKQFRQLIEHHDFEGSLSQ